MDIDENGNELLRLGIDVIDRDTEKAVNVQIRFPVLAKWDDYFNELAMLFHSMAQDFETMYIPDDMIELKDRQDFRIWAGLTKHALQVKLFQEQIKNLFFNYLDPIIEGKGMKYTKEFIMNNAPMDMIFQMFVAILCVEDWLKKKSIFLMGEIYQVQIKLSCSSTSQNPVDTISEKSKTSAYSKPVSFSDGLQSTIVN